MTPTSPFRIMNEYKLVFLYMLFSSLLISSCTQEPQLWTVKSKQQGAGEYIASNPDFSEFARLVEVTGFGALLNVRGPYTILLPNNEAMFKYYKQKNVNSLMDFTPEFQRELVMNHIISNEITTGDFGLGAIRDTNAIGDFVATEFQGSDIILNKYSKIIKRDIELANGLIDVIDQVLDPLSKNVFEVLKNDPGLSIFTEGLRLTGIQDTLSKISFPYGKKHVRCRFTILAVPDTLYNRMGINSVGDLIKKYAAEGETGPSDIMQLNNGFYRYMEYHCMNRTNYLSDFTSTLYPILSMDNYISVTVDNDYKLNLISKTQKYTGFYIGKSNIPTKNGAIHIINNLLPVITPERMTITMETTDFPEIRQGDWFGKYYMKWNDGQNSFEKIKFEGDFLGYYYKTHDIPTPLIKYDALFMLGFWEIEVTFPKVIKGKYKIIYGSPWVYNLNSNFQVYLDGKLSSYWYDGPKGGNQQIADGDFETTSEHRIKLVSITYGALYWDFIQFVPVE